jgi:hypothetical protein
MSDVKNDKLKKLNQNLKDFLMKNSKNILNNPKKVNPYNILYYFSEIARK